MNRNDALMTRAERIDPVRNDASKDFAESVQAQEILDSILQTEPQQTAPKRALRTKTLRHGSHLGSIARRVAAVGVAAAIVFGVTTFGDPAEGPARGGGVVWSAELVRFAEASPRLLITQEGWVVTRADERTRDEGEMTFVNGGDRLDLHWRPRDTHDRYLQDRKHEAAHSWDISIDARKGLLMQYDHTSPGVLSLTAMWLGEQHSLELRGDSFDSVDEYRAVAATLQTVDVDTWLSAMPDSVIKPNGRAIAVDEMLKDIPVPDSVDVAELKSRGVVSDRYQLGAQVTGAVACGWIDQWVEAKAASDLEREQQAVNAMRGSHDWAILLEMEKQGEWSEVLWQYADGMVADNSAVFADDTATDGPISGYEAGLGCTNK
jgi:hypothetical protein